MTYRLSGWASTTSIDQEHCRFDHGSIVIPKQMPPLYISHKCDGDPVGTIISLEWREKGLWAEVEVPDELAEYKGFSVGVNCRQFKGVGWGADGHAVVTRALMNELSLTNSPCNAEALILTRTKIVPPVAKPAVAKSWDEIQRQIRWNHIKLFGVDPYAASSDS